MTYYNEIKLKLKIKPNLGIVRASLVVVRADDVRWGRLSVRRSFAPRTPLMTLRRTMLPLHLFKSLPAPLLCSSFASSHAWR